MSDTRFMRIPIATTLVCSTLSTFAFYQGFAALFSGSARTDDESAANTKKDAAKSEQTTAQPKPAIAKPETMTAKNGGDRTKTSVKQGKQLIAANGIPTVSVPPTMTPQIALTVGREGIDDTPQSSSSVAPPETIAASQSRPDQSSPFTTAAAPLSDVKGHWAESYIESLAAKGVVRGFLDGNFHPDEAVTAQQFARMAQKAFTASSVSYSDLRQRSGDRTPTRADAAAFIYQTLARAETAPAATAVQISGAVPRPGIYAIPGGSKADAPPQHSPSDRFSPDRSSPDRDLPTVSRAIQRAGGALSGADLRQVQIHRVGDTTARRVINVDVQEMLQTGDRSRDIILQQGDKLFIPAAATAASNQATGALPTPERSARLVESTK